VRNVSDMTARRQAIAHGASVVGIVGAWLYHGLVPKLWKVDADEQTFFRVIGLGPTATRRAVRATGVAEVVFAAVMAGNVRRRWPFALTLAAMPPLAIGAGVTDPKLLTKAFNPVSLNLVIAALAVVGLATHRDTGSRAASRS